MSVADAIVIAGEDYATSATARRLHAYPRPSGVEHLVSDVDLKGLYDRLVRLGNTATREIYDRILNAAPFGRCPLCGEGTATTLDHHLPKRYYPAVAVTPDNLVPACRDCQDAKLDFCPTGPGDLTIHPYFDEVDNVRWLAAQVGERSPPVITFHVGAGLPWSAELQQRVEHHFTLLDLGTMYSLKAASELADQRAGLRDLFERGGADLVRQHHVRESNSRGQTNPNSWMAAMHRACAESTWFCEVGHGIA
jgi:hypothetical protein